MLVLRVAAAAINQTPLDWAGNLRRINAVIDEALDGRVDILCLPELCITGYGCEDAFFSLSTRHQALASLAEIVERTRDKNIVIAVGFPFVIQKTLYNCVALVADGRILGIVPKQNLASDGLHYEPRWFKPWPAGTRVTVPIKNSNGAVLDIHVGDIIFDIRGFKIGIEICEDAWVAERPGASLAKRGVDIILNPSASHFAFGKNEVRKSFVIEGSRAFHCTYVYANLLGNESGRVIFDGDTLVAQNGKLVASGPRFSFKDHILTTANVDISKTRTAQMVNGAFRPELEWEGVNCRDHRFASDQPILEDKEIVDTKMTKFEEFERAASLGLFDYMRKSQSKGFVLSLSGGADSSACACLIRKTIENGLAELGPLEFVTRSGFIVDIDADVQNCIQILEPDEEHKVCFTKAILSHWLTCIYQGTENSSQATLDSAETLANGLGAQFNVWNVDDLVAAYVLRVEKALGRSLSWDTDDIPLQNIQARVRSPGVWMIANIKRALLISTSNRSEAAVGYATMDGDTSGSLSPIAGVDKQFVLEWLLHLKDESVYWKALEDYYKLEPTAELRPLDQNQKDEDDLMPYPVLELIEECAIRDKMSPAEVFQNIIWNPTYTDVGAKKVFEWVEKFFKLWSRNQWKRERYAPSFHYDDENLDPRSWCRWPILSGGMAQDLEQLKKALQL